jgi:phospholipid/cholesterol/gamma-HCH transport system substrate-binding protein
VALLIVLVAALVAIVEGGGSSYTVNAEFTDAGQIVSGDLVEIGGLEVGRVSAVKLTSNGLADLVLRITDGSLVPLHGGTIATIAQPGLAGEANRVITLLPGPRANPEIHSGGILSTADTRGEVDLDELLDTLDPATRRSLQQLIAEGAYVVSPPADREFNRGLHYLDPALSQTAALGREILLDRAGLRQLLSSVAALSAALAQRPDQIQGSIVNTAATLRLIAGQSGALGDALARAPAVFKQARGVLADADYAVKVLEPTLRDLRPVAGPAATLLRKVLPVVRDAQPTIAGIRALLPSAQAALKKMLPVARAAVPALKSIAGGIGPLLPVVSGLRPFMPDLIGGFFDGVAANTGGGYDANGHYIRVSPTAGQGGGLTGLVPPLGPQAPTLSPRSGLNDRCPGGATNPAPDFSNPWIPPGQHGICNPADDQP